MSNWGRFSRQSLRKDIDSMNGMLLMKKEEI
jgi:hypothetical protein